MTEPTRHDLLLAGCTPRPLAGYLSAVGVLRLVATQLDAAATGRWEGGRFVLRSTADRAALERFFEDQYRPTPVVSPWNGGSGFYAKDNTDGRDFLMATEGDRLATYRETFSAARAVVEAFGLAERPTGDDKALLIEALRAALPDEALDWIDAALTLTTDGVRFPPLLGTGGNDGRLDFSNNFLARLADVLAEPEGSVRKVQEARFLRHAWLASALFGSPAPSLNKNAAGQFDPGSGGGANMGPGASAKSMVNPWRFILMLEGAMAFAAAATRRLEATGPGALVFPFSVRASSAGYGSATLVEEDSGRDELWLPLWESSATWTDLSGLLREGRARVTGRGGPRVARDGTDFARAISQLGVQRGLSAFERYGFHVRNGLATQAVPLGRWPVRRIPGADLLVDLDRWLDRLRRASRTAPAALQRCRRDIEEAVLELTTTDGPAPAQRLLIALGQCERQMVRSSSWCSRDNALPPIPWLSRGWVEQADDRSPVFALAGALAARGLRARLTPLKAGRFAQWDDNARLKVDWHDGALVRSLLSLLVREDIEQATAAENDGRRGTRWQVSSEHIAWWLAHPEVDRDLQALAHGLMLVRPDHVPRRAARGKAWVPPLYALLHLATDGRPIPRGGQESGPVKRTPGLLTRAAAGDAAEASALALRRLRGAGVGLLLDHRPRHLRPIQHLHTSRDRARRIAAALAFPLSDACRGPLLQRLCAPDPETPSLHPEHA